MEYVARAAAVVWRRRYRNDAKNASSRLTEIAVCTGRQEQAGDAH